MCICMHEVGASPTKSICRPEKNFQKSVLSFWHVGPGNTTRMGLVAVPFPWQLLVFKAFRLFSLMSV